MSSLQPPPSESAEIAELRAALERMTNLADQLVASSTVQGMRSGAQGGEAHALRHDLHVLRSSFFWRLTMPLRLATDMARGVKVDASPETQRLRRLAGMARREGLAPAWALLRRHLRRKQRPVALPAANPAVTAAPDAKSPQARPKRPAPLPPPGALMAPNVLIIAELTLQQCAKYRVWQKQEHFARLGVPCRVVDWRRTEECLSAAATATQVIFYRVPGYPHMLQLIATLAALRLPLAWEVDDLIFDRALFLHNRNVESLDPEIRQGILSGVELYRDALRACRTGIASTPYLAQAMRDAGLRQVRVVENALDAETLALAERLRSARAPTLRATTPRAHILITYGSGTKTHDADFREAAPALLALLRANPAVRLRIVGELTLPPGLDSLPGQVEQLPPVPYARYMALLAESDIAIAPLEETLFNDAKSNIKFLEAAILGLPSVCSPRAHFKDVIEDGANGLLAQGEAAWLAALTRLANDAGLRARLGEAALQTAVARYAPEAVARTQVAPLLARLRDRRPPAAGPQPDAGRPALRVLLANIYYAPRSYGGATLVVEEMARRLHARGDTGVYVFTGLPQEARPRVLTRTDQDGITVFAVPTAAADIVASFDDPSAGVAFGQVLDAVRPDVVHLHAVQDLSASLAVACALRGIPYVITLHDAWWLCARQFMVREDGTYCFQTSIDLHICQNCVPGAHHLGHRARLLHAALRGAALLLAPSEAHRALHLANGIPPDRIEVAPNGVRLPQTRLPRPPSARLRFAYVGGNVEVKGFSLVKRAFEALATADWELILVDNTLNLGFSSVDPADWHVRGTLRTVPAYTQEELDSFFAGIDVLVFPSQWKESFGLTVREALARDVWVIATAGGGPAEAIMDGVNGTLIPLDGRPEPLQAAIEALLARPGRLDGYRNPHAGEIMDYAAQARALHATLARVAAQAPLRTAGKAGALSHEC